MKTFNPDQNNAQEFLIHWIDQAPGAFSVHDLGKMSNDDMFLLVENLELLVRVGYLERHGNKRGWYIKAESELVEQDYINADSEPIDIWLPLGLSDEVCIFSGSIIIIAGNPNVGKTSMILNMIKENRHKGWDQYLFNSESDDGELKDRLETFGDITLDQWGFKSYRRAEDFHQVVFKGKNTINYIDYLELHDNFYIVGGLLKKIHNVLDGAIAVVALQKNPGSDTGLGGQRTLEVTRLAISLEFQKAKCVKGKRPRVPGNNPTGKYKNYKLYDGHRFESAGGWHHEKERTE